MYILGAGLAYPENELSSAFLESLGLRLEEHERHLLGRFGIESRRTTLPLEYISRTHNGDVLEARAAATDTPTSLGALAARRALAAAGITTEQIGLLIADCATPQQTCPSEAQRIGGALGVKVPAYDIVLGAGAFCLALEILSAWRDDRFPEYVLFVSTNCPTHYVRYSGSGLSPYLFGDGASAFVVSLRNPGKLKVLETCLKRHSSSRPVITVDRHITLAVSQLVPEKELFQMIAQTLRQISERSPIHADELKLIGPQLFSGDAKSFARELNLPVESIVHPGRELGYSLGASMGAGLAQLWEGLTSGQRVLAMHGGDGLVNGSVLLAVE